MGMKAIELVYFNAGGGHRAAAQALEAVIHQQRRPWRVRLTNLFEVLDAQGRFRKIAGFAPEDYYNVRLARGWTLGLAQELKLLQAMIRAAHPALVRRLRQHWAETEPDLVVSLIPNFNRAMFDSLATTLPGVPYLTVMTDMADYPPNFWIEPGQAQHLVCGSATAASQARAMGYRDGQIHRVSGMILRPDFYAPAPHDRRARRQQLGLDAGAATAVVMFGGQGSTTMLRIATQLHDVPLILLCGHNARLANTLRALPAAAPRVVVEHTADVAHYMRLGDFLIGKPGPGCISEALQCGLPVIVARNAWTLPQERFNTNWVREQGVGLVLKSFGTIREAVAELRARLPEFSANVHKEQNRALFELPEIFDDLLDISSTACPWRPEQFEVGALGTV
jgi:UDP-N-acetylglucosamine:LPS N-acetylglucosamine transferase